MSVGNAAGIHFVGKRNNPIFSMSIPWGILYQYGTGLADVVLIFMIVFASMLNNQLNMEYIRINNADKQ